MLPRRGPIIESRPPEARQSARDPMDLCSIRSREGIVLEDGLTALWAERDQPDGQSHQLAQARHVALGSLGELLLADQGGAAGRAHAPAGKGLVDRLGRSQ